MFMPKLFIKIYMLYILGILFGYPLWVVGNASGTTSAWKVPMFIKEITVKSEIIFECFIKKNSHRMNNNVVI